MCIDIDIICMSVRINLTQFLSWVTDAGKKLSFK